MPTGISAIRDHPAHVYCEPGGMEEKAARLRNRVAEAFQEALFGVGMRNLGDAYAGNVSGRLSGGAARRAGNLIDA